MVRAQYLSLFLVGALLIGAAKMVDVIFALPSERDFWDLLIAFVGICGFTAVFYPLYYWSGTQLSRSACLSPLSSLRVAPMLYNMGVKNNFWGLLEVFSRTPPFSGSSFCSPLQGSCFFLPAPVVLALPAKDF